MVSRTKHDVFISFRGTDVRSGFLSYLKKELRQKQIDAYVDDRLERGDEISSALFKAIEESLISLIIFSEHYAFSKWCLEELVKIMECMDRNKQIVIPIFYNTDPSYVRHQKGSYADAFAEHDANYKEKAQIWRTALNKAANISGFHSSNYGDEVELIEEIANSLCARFNILNQSDFGDPVGIDQRIAELESLMCRGSEDVRVIGIWGMGGIGKTTIANAMFNRLCFEYEGCCFLGNIREEIEKHGIIYLKNKILSTLLKENDLRIDTPHGIPPYVKRRLLRKKVLVVLDDISDSDQLENLFGAFDCFGLGSRIIITTRDRQVLRERVDKIYEVKPLIYNDAIQLFMLNAFKQNYLDIDWIELSSRVINYVQGIPLALKVLGSFLCGKSKEEWESQLEKLKKMPFKKIQDVLRLSYDSLDHQEKDIFLHIACSFKGYQKCEIISLLDACGLSTTIGLKVLRDKALIDEIKSWKSEIPCVSMHDLIQEMGREIVREESREDPGKHSHLWDPNDIYEVLKNNTGTDAIQSIMLYNSNIKEELFLHPEVFARMHRLKFLKLATNVYLPQGLGTLPNELRLLDWPNYPLKSLPSTFCAKHLVLLDMSCSRVKKLWDGVMPLVNLKKIDLSSSRYLLELPDFSMANNLEEVVLLGCLNLLHVHPSILSLHKLVKLDLSRCEKLTRLQGAVIEELPSSIGYLSKLEYFNLDGCRSLMHLPDNLNLRSLRCLGIGNCKELRSLPLLPLSIEKLCAVNCRSLETIQFTLMAADLLNRNMIDVDTENCMKLDEHSRNTIGLNAHLSLINYAFKSSEECVRQVDDNILPGVIYPGSKVPEWFKYKTSHGSTTITPHSKLLAFIFCVILPPLVTSFIVHCFLENNDGERLLLDTMSFDATKPDSDHVCLLYQECRHFINERIVESRASYQNIGYNPKFSFEVTGPMEEDIVIKGCGVYPIYASEMEEEEEQQLGLGNSTKRCRDSDELNLELGLRVGTSDDPQQPFPPTKRLKQFDLDPNTSSTSK